MKPEYYWIIAIINYIMLTHWIGKKYGTKRKIGYGKSIFWSVVLSPIIGIIITLSSERLPAD
jgi:hypothetical protein